MKAFSLVTVTFFCLTLVGCNLGSRSGEGPVAVVDLDAIAQKLGKDKQILQLIEHRHVSLNEQLTSTQNSLLQQLNQKKSEFGDLSEEETKQLAQLQNQANTILANTRSQALSNLTAFQLEVVNRFRDETRPVVMELAAKKGCRVVLSKNDSVVFGFASAIDLTDEVVACLESKKPAQATSQSGDKGSSTSVKQAASHGATNQKK